MAFYVLHPKGKSKLPPRPRDTTGRESKLFFCLRNISMPNDRGMFMVIDSSIIALLYLPRLAPAGSGNRANRLRSNRRFRRANTSSRWSRSAKFTFLRQITFSAKGGRTLHHELHCPCMGFQKGRKKGFHHFHAEVKSCCTRRVCRT